MAHYVLLNPFHGGLGGGVGHGRASLVSTLGVSAVWCFGTGSRETLEHFGLIEFSGEAWVPTERGKEAGLKTEERT